MRHPVMRASDFLRATFEGFKERFRKEDDFDRRLHSSACAHGLRITDFQWYKVDYRLQTIVYVQCHRTQRGAGVGPPHQHNVM